MKTFKELHEYWNFVGFCLWAGNWKKASYVCNNLIEPLAKEHPILNYLASSLEEIIIAFLIIVAFIINYLTFN